MSWPVGGGSSWFVSQCSTAGLNGNGEGGWKSPHLPAPLKTQDCTTNFDWGEFGYCNDCRTFYFHFTDDISWNCKGSNSQYYNTITTNPVLNNVGTLSKLYINNNSLQMSGNWGGISSDFWKCFRAFAVISESLFLVQWCLISSPVACAQIPKSLDVMYCWWRDSQSLQFYTEKHFPESVLQPKRVTDLMPVNLISWKMFLQLFPFSAACVSSLSLLPSRHFWHVLLPSNSVTNCKASCST